MPQPEPVASGETIADLAARLAVAERALAARDKTIAALVTREHDRTAGRPSTFDAMEENAALQQVVARKTLELEAQNARLLREIEARQAVEAALAKNEEKHRRLFAASSEALMTVFPPDWKFASANAAAVALFGVKDEQDFITREPWEVSPERQPDGELSSVKAQRMIATALESGSHFFDWTHRRITGEIFPATVMLTRVESDRRIGLQGTVRDLSEQHRAQEELRSAHAQLEQMMAHSPAITYRLKVGSEHRSPLAVSANIVRLLGFTAAETLREDWWPTHIHPNDRELVFASAARTLTQGSGRNEFRLRHKTGDYRWIEDHQRVLEDISGRPTEIVGVWMDVTDRKAAESELAKLHQQLLEASRQAGMAEVATGVLHNVGNVLNSVNVSATLVADRVRHSKGTNIVKLAAMFDEHRADLAAFLTHDPRGQMIPEYLATLKDSLVEEQQTTIAELEHLRSNIEHIKDIVAMQQNYAKNSGFIETVALTDLVEDALRMNANSLARHEVKLVRDFQIRPALSTDKHKVMQIIVNLVRNAKFACDESGRPDKALTVRIAGDQQAVRVSVCDNGIGIPPENLARIFNHGFTTKKDGHGFGLHSGALAARELGGTLSVHSDGSGCGATFTLELPLPGEEKTA